MSSPKGHSKACWNAKGSVCKCKCKKKYHGLGRVIKKELGLIREPDINEIIERNHEYSLGDLF